jgi:hypothetical protein
MNSWIVQGNPQQFLIDWYLDEYARVHPNETDWWILYKKHKDMMLPGDELFIWKAASEPSRSQKPAYFDWKESISRTEKICGIIALGKITDYPKPYYESAEELKIFQKYRVVESYTFASEDKKITYMVECNYGDSKNIFVRKPLLQEVIWDKLGQSPQTELGVFKYKRRGTRSVKLEAREADILRSLISAGR